MIWSIRVPLFAMPPPRLLNQNCIMVNVTNNAACCRLCSGIFILHHVRYQLGRKRSGRATLAQAPTYMCPLCGGLGYSAANWCNLMAGIVIVSVSQHDDLYYCQLSFAYRYLLTVVYIISFLSSTYLGEPASWPVNILVLYLAITAFPESLQDPLNTFHVPDAGLPSKPINDYRPSHCIRVLCSKIRDARKSLRMFRA